MCFVEREPFCQKVLAKHWPNVPVYSDICQFGGKPYRGADLLTGGFPCQPFSQAGKRRGKEDDRYLWPEMLRVIQTTKPRWVLGENVAGLDGLGLDDCISDLESIGYEVAPPLEIPACAIGAFHERNRIWIVANSNSERTQGGIQRVQEDNVREVKSLALLPSQQICDNEDKLSGPIVLGAGNGLPNRSHRTRAAGNAIVPQVAYQLLKEIRKFC